MLICFDLDGPVLDVSHRHWCVYHDILAGAGETCLGESVYWELKRQRVLGRDILARTTSRISVEGFRRQWMKMIEEENSLLLDRLWSGLGESLSRLSRVHTLVLVTLRQRPELVTRQLTRLGVIDHFSCVLSHPAKTEERWMTKLGLLRGAGIVPGEVDMVIGDTETEIHLAQFVGAASVAVSFGIRTKEILMALGPDALLESPENLTTYLRAIHA